MPIRPENRDRYPPDWPAISLRIRQRAGNRCEVCGVRNHALVGRVEDGTWFDAVPEEDGLRLRWPEPGTWSACTRDNECAHLRIVRIVLTVAHLDHIPEHCDDENLKAMCQRCHLAYDAKHHAATRYRTRRAQLALGDLFSTPEEMPQ